MEMDSIESETLENEYNELLYGLDDETAEKFRKFTQDFGTNLKALADYAEVDVDEWGNPIY